MNQVKPVFKARNDSLGSVEFLNDSNLKEASAFLMDNENFSLFLLGNLEAHGPKLTLAPNSGNFKLIRCNGRVIAVFSLTRRGNLVIQSSSTDDWIMEKILSASEKESIDIKGLIGEWSFCQKFWNLLKQRNIIRKDIFVSKQILYAVDLERQSIFDSPNVRLLTPTDFTNWEPHRIAYLKEEGLPNDLSYEQMQELFLEKVRERISWGYFENGNLVSMAELNAKARDIGQVGGVYTTPNQRKKGLAKAIMHGLMQDARGLHKIRKLIIFTGETNKAARKLYESLNINTVGYYALMFGESRQPEDPQVD